MKNYFFFFFILLFRNISSILNEIFLREKKILNVLMKWMCDACDQNTTMLMNSTFARTTERVSMTKTQNKNMGKRRNNETTTVTENKSFVFFFF